MNEVCSLSCPRHSSKHALTVPRYETVYVHGAQIYCPTLHINTVSVPYTISIILYYALACSCYDDRSVNHTVYIHLWLQLNKDEFI